MKLGFDMKEKTGLYLGTEIDETWWKRYMKDGLLARGNGKYWFDDKAFYFHRYLTKEPLSIPWANVVEYKIGNWHAGKWCMGLPILKILWNKDGLSLSSGFLLTRNLDDMNKLISDLKVHQKH